MRVGLDTNVLIYAHLPAFPSHEKVSSFVHHVLREGTVVITPMVLHELIHVVTDPRRFEPPLTMPEALALAAQYLERSNVECLPVDEASARLMVELMVRHRLGRNRVADTLFVATLLTHGVTDLVTCNRRDYEVFDQLNAIDPTAPVEPDGG